MESKSFSIILVISTMLTGLLAGFFYTWSFTIMQSLDLAGPISASRAMVSINAHIRDGWFGTIFFGAPISVIISLVVLLRTNQNGVKWAFIAMFFAMCSLAVTFTQHLPLNEQLANGLRWSEYFEVWTQWNHVRMTTSTLAFICMLFVLISRD
ncbi:anthrone oxygenase family protein [Vibrio sp. RC27]